tara:strand:+ start:25602 stop:26306 length:705 start_codon:yes stop_codon:yes gene_type:complete
MTLVNNYNSLYKIYVIAELSKKKLLGFSAPKRYWVYATILAAIIIATSTVNLASADTKDPQKFIENLGTRAIDILSNAQNTEFSLREEAFRKLLVDAFHMPTISRFVVGRYWRSASEKQKEEYDEIFLDFLTRVYASRFNTYNGEFFKVLQVIEQPKSSDKVVRTHIQRDGGQPIGVDYRIRDFESGYKVVDVNVEGISMLHTHRVEFASVINRKGFDGFLSMLRARITAPVEN